ncbi:SCO family protein [Novilysobacter defluvii]|uniref:Electron transporter SenC n=1 Tax=Lysobacter defluvii IMMIB APB-9 = DSM 18482 TaxID=1385515 RepID=A0A0A0M788_9GAMM|nr:SCO family protein [Lysobacter defluvii]KGO98863.1 electron transporter SenC [Lysobacter defluvii IMMIB APB-9 = DSM 18482]
MKQLLVLLLAAMLALPLGVAAEAPLPRDSLYQVPLDLVDQDGRALDWRQLRGKPRVVGMFYASCHFICPLIIDSGKVVERHLGEHADQLGIVLISIDPERDDPAALRQLVQQRKLDTTRWSLAAPPADQVRTAAGVLGVRYRRLADGEFNHTSPLVLLDAQGRELARTEKIGSRVDPAFLDAVRAAVD